MDSNYLANPATFLVQVTFGLYALVVILRFLLQVVRADFYNPLSQFVVKLTSPLVTPLRRIIPSAGKLDLSSLLLAWLVKAIELLLVLWIGGRGLHFAAPLLLAIPELLSLIINVFLFATIILAILSWFAPSGYNPAIALLSSLTEPLLQPVRRLLPPAGGMDFSPMVLIIALMLLKMLLIPPIEHLIGQLL